MTTKTNKSFKKRLKVTKNGKVLKRKPGHCHFNAKAKRSNQLDKKRIESFTVDKKTLKQFLPNN